MTFSFDLRWPTPAEWMLGGIALIATTTAAYLWTRKESEGPSILEAALRRIPEAQALGGEVVQFPTSVAH